MIGLVMNYLNRLEIYGYTTLLRTCVTVSGNAKEACPISFSMAFLAAFKYFDLLLNNMLLSLYVESICRLIIHPAI